MARERIFPVINVAFIEVKYLGADHDKAPVDCGHYVVTTDDAGYSVGEIGPFDHAVQAEAAKVDFLKMIRSLLTLNTKH
jgi:hypothetical protein